MDDYFTEYELRDEYGFQPKQKKSLKEKVKATVKCDRNSVKNFFFGFFPILSWLPNYSLKSHLPGDIIGGITTAVVRIPQSLAYGLLAGVDPINGMYTAFFSPLVYTFLGTSKHISVGTFAVISLMLGSALEKFLITNPFVSSHNATEVTMATVSDATMATVTGTTMGSTTAENSLDANSELAAYKMAVVGSITLLVGLIQIVLGMFNLGFVALFLSDPLVSGFTTSAALYVFTAQVKYFFGISLARQAAPFALVKTYVELFTRIGETKPAEVIISVITIVLLYPVKLINMKYKKQLHNIPIPMELIIVVVATIVSANIDLQALYGVEIVGNVPSGLPMPVVPNVSLWPSLISDAFSIAIVSFAITVSIGKLFAKKHGYKISPNQELFALGVSQLSCGVFQGHACSGSLARSSVKESSGTKTQLSDLVSCVVMLLVLLFVGPLLQPLPVSCLSSIIMVNIRTLFNQFFTLPKLWKLCKYDFAVWILTFTAVVLLGVDLGLAVGVLCLLATVVLRVYNPSVTVRGGLRDTNLYRDINKFGKAEEVDGIKIIRFPQSPFFGNKEALEAISLQTLCVKKICNERQAVTAEPSADFEQSRALLGTDSDSDDANNKLNGAAKWTPRKSSQGNSLDDYVVIMDAKTGNVKFDGDVTPRDVEAPSMTSRSCSNGSVRFSRDHCFHTVIFDCSGWSFIDTMGMETVKQVCKDFRDADLRVYFAELQASVFSKLTEAEILGDNGVATPYPSLQMAVKAATKPPPSTEL